MSDKYVSVSNLSIYYTWKNIEKPYIIAINLNYRLQRGAENLNYLRYLDIQDNCNYINEKLETITNNTPTRNMSIK